MALICAECGAEKKSNHGLRCKRCASNTRPPHTDIARKHMSETRIVMAQRLRDGIPSGYKKCTKCKNILASSSFDHSGQKSDGLDSWCKECKRKYREKNKVACRARSREWDRKHPAESRAQKHRRRARFINAGNYAGADWWVLVNYYSPDGKCLICRKTFDITSLTVDHVSPLNIGGPNTIDNLQPLCKSCNSRRSKTKAEDYRPDNGAFAKSILLNERNNEKG